MKALRSELVRTKTKARKGLDMNALTDEQFKDCTRLCKHDFHQVLTNSQIKNKDHLFIF
jgi:hypothetical protein